MHDSLKWAPVPIEWIADAPPKCAVQVWLALWAHVDRRKEVLSCFPSNDRIALLCNIDTRTVRRGLDWLIGRGYVAKAYQGGRKVFVVTWSNVGKVAQGSESKGKRTKLPKKDKTAGMPDKTAHIIESKINKQTSPQNAHAGALDSLDRIYGALRARHGENWPEGQRLGAEGIFESIRVLERAQVVRRASVEDVAITLDSAFFEFTNDQLIRATEEYVRNTRRLYWPNPAQIKKHIAR